LSGGIHAGPSAAVQPAIPGREGQGKKLKGKKAKIRSGHWTLQAKTSKQAIVNTRFCLLTFAFLTCGFELFFRGQQSSLYHNVNKLLCDSE